MGFNKLLKQIGMVLVLLAASIFITSCSPKSTTPSPDAAQIPPFIPGAPGASPNNYSGTTYADGATTTFTPVSNSAFNKWVKLHPVDPTNLIINVNIAKVTNRNSYVGEVKIHYTDNGTDYESSLTSHTESYKGTDYFQYNKFFNISGKPVFTGFFEDNLGAIVLILDNGIDLGDGAGSTLISGSVWFKNFVSTFAPYDGGGGFDVVLPCWFRTIGPYDCRSFTTINKTAINPDNGYEKLGTFTGMDRIKALNLNK